MQGIQFVYLCTTIPYAEHSLVGMSLVLVGVGALNISIFSYWGIWTGDEGFLTSTVLEWSITYILWHFKLLTIDHLLSRDFPLLLHKIMKEAASINVDNPNITPETHKQIYFQWVTYNTSSYSKWNW